jgi:hypothetical protein
LFITGNGLTPETKPKPEIRNQRAFPKFARPRAEPPPNCEIGINNWKPSAASLSLGPGTATLRIHKKRAKNATNPGIQISAFLRLSLFGFIRHGTDILNVEKPSKLVHHLPPTAPTNPR